MLSPNAYKAVNERPVVAVKKSASKTTRNIIRVVAPYPPACFAPARSERMELFQRFDGKKAAKFSAVPGLLPATM
jgi:hypothetical protein